MVYNKQIIVGPGDKYICGNHESQVCYNFILVIKSLYSLPAQQTQAQSLMKTLKAHRAIIGYWTLQIYGIAVKHNVEYQIDRLTVQKIGSERDWQVDRESQREKERERERQKETEREIGKEVEQ